MNTGREIKGAEFFPAAFRLVIRKALKLRMWFYCGHVEKRRP